MLRVGDLERSISFYTDVLGMRLLRRRDYPGGRVEPPDAGRVNWYETPGYAPYLEAWKGRWEFASYLNRAAAGEPAAARKKKQSNR